MRLNTSATAAKPEEPKALTVEDMYAPYNNQRIATTQISAGVWYLGHFQGFGEVWARKQLWYWNRNNCLERNRQKGLVRSQAFQEKALDEALKNLKDCLVLSTTPTYFSQYQNACLLKLRGFELLEGSCYLHPDYVTAQPTNCRHPGVREDGQEHFEHIWYKVIGNPKNTGAPATTTVGLNNCGVDGRWGLEAIQEHDVGSRRRYLCVGWLPRGTNFPDGWKCFYSAEDYKLGHNFQARASSKKLLGLVQKCPHNFDLKIFKDWMPDFDVYAHA